jgi:hypothetical protein
MLATGHVAARVRDNVVHIWCASIAVEIGVLVFATGFNVYPARSCE